MKTSRLGLMGVAFGLVGVLGASVQAASIGINYSTARDQGATNYNLASGDVTGVVAQGNWNNAPLNAGATANITGPTAGVIVDSTGAATAVTTTWTSTNTWDVYNVGQGNATQQLMNSYLDNTNAGAPTTVTVSNIPYAVYDVYAYVGSDGNGRSGHGTVGGSTFYFVTDDNPFSNLGAFVQGTSTTLGGAQNANYLLFSGVTGSTFTYQEFRDSNNVGLHGIQIVDVTPVPEASHVLLAAVAALGLAGLVRRRLPVV